MNEEASDALASDGGRSPKPGNEFSSVFRESGVYRKAAAVAVICAFMSVGLILMDHTGGSISPKSNDVRPVVLAFPMLQYGLPVNSVQSTDDLMAQLKAHQLWEMPADNRITPIIFTNYPADFDSLDVETKKKAFFRALLPEALLARAEIAKERKSLEKILAKFEEPDRLAFDGEENAWQDRLTNSEVQFVDYLVSKYRSRKASDLLTRVDTFPASLILAQAALESSWGSSRFAEQGNNIFGLWTWGKKGLVPTDRDADKDHKVATYDTILGSVRAYLLTLNRLPAYRRLRQLRQQTRDPLVLAEGLHRYSERGMDYVAELKQIIRYNQLERYDHCRLADLPAGSISDFQISRR
jgi:Bax protein